MITKTLLEQGICFAVVQSNSFLTKHKIMQNQEWEIIAAEKDRAKLSRFVMNQGFYLPESHKNPEGIISYVLDLNEIGEFKRLIPDYFDKVMENDNGRVWEIKDQPFKNYLKAC